MEITMAKFWKAMDESCVTSAEFLFSTNESKHFTKDHFTVWLESHFIRLSSTQETIFNLILSTYTLLSFVCALDNITNFM